VSDQNVETIRKAHDAFRERDLGMLAEIVHPEVEWHEPSGGTRRGHADLLDSWQGYSGQWSEFESSPERFLDADDHVIVIGSFRARAAATGIEVEVPFVHIYRLEEVPRAIADFAGGSLGKLGVTIDG